MRFPEQHCVPTYLLTENTAHDLMTKMLSDGSVADLTPSCYKGWSRWGYVGIDHYGSLNVWDHPSDFMEPNAWMNYEDVKEIDYPNILTKEWLEEYLND